MIPLLAGMGIVKVIARPSPRVLVIALSSSAVAASYWVAAELQAAGAQAHRLEFISYAEPQLITAITEQLVRADLVVTLGGLGEARAVGHTASDLRAVAAAIGANDFTPVAISPGSDHGFILAEEKVPLLALPAEVYPVFVLTKLLLEPMVAKLMGAGTAPVMSSAYLAQPLRIDPGVLTCVPAMVRDARMTISGRPRGLEGMNQIYHADALAILTSEYGLVDAGAEVFYLPLN
jgi:molybdopterin molybdotransferase